MYVWFLAARYMLTRVISYVAMVAICFGVAALIIVMSVMNGFLAETVALVRGTTADIVVFPKDTYDGLPARREVLEDVAVRQPGVRGVSGRLVRPGMFKAGGVSELTRSSSQHAMSNQVLVLGLDPVDERGVSDFERYLADVEEPELAVDDPSQPFYVDRANVDNRYTFAPLPRVLVGIELMEHLRLRKGAAMEIMTLSDDTMRALSGAETGEQTVAPAAGTFIIAGAFKTGHYDFDIGHVFLERDRFSQWCGTSQEVSELYVSAEPDADLDLLRDTMKIELLQAGIDCNVETWRDRHQILLSAVENEKVILFIVLGIMTGLTCLLVLAMMMTMVHEKVRDIGILASMGAPPSGIGMIFAMCGLMVGTVGGILGAALGVLVARNANNISDFIEQETGYEIFKKDVYAFSEIPTVIQPDVNVLIVLSIMVVSFVLSLIPATRASLFDPVRALRHE